MTHRLFVAANSSMSAAGGRAEPLVTLADDGSLSC
eukprot:COSAG04_NODE_6744_length_1265_cov_1.032590_3_plen_34_part_01